MTVIRSALRSHRTQTPTSGPPRRPARSTRALLSLLATAAITVACAVTSPAPASAASSGTLSISPGASAAATVTDAALGDVLGEATFTVPSQRTAYVAVQLRSSSAQAGYRAKARILSSGEVTVSISRVASGTETSVASGSTGITASSGQKLTVEGSVTGTNPVAISVRAWIDGSTEPAWQQSYSDSSGSRITSSGGVRVWGYLSGGATSTAQVAFAKATATAVGGSGNESAAPGSKPSAGTTGVPSGTTLSRHDGDITVTQAGTVISGLDIHGFVTVKAANVTIKNSIVRGGKSKGYALGLITNYGYDNLVVDHVDVVAEYPSVYFDGIKGWDFTARSVHVVGNVDSVKIHGDNVLIENSLLENTVYYASDPAQGGGATHNDNVQILRGKNLRILGNTIRGATNFAILGGAEQADVGLVVDGNWLDGGHCTLKLQVKNGWSQTAKVTDNKFGPNRKVVSCPFTAYPAVSLTQSGNTMELTGAVVKPLIVVS